MSKKNFQKAIEERPTKKTANQSKKQVLEHYLMDVPKPDNVSLKDLQDVVWIIETLKALPEDVQNWILSYLTTQKDPVDAGPGAYDGDLSLGEAAKVLGKTSRTLHNWLKSGKIKGEKRDNRWFFSQDEIMKQMK